MVMATVMVMVMVIVQSMQPHASWMEFYSIDRSVFHMSATMPDPDSLYGCSCVICEPNTCPCIQDSTHEYDRHDHTLHSVSPGQIYECCARCSCAKTCSNRVVQERAQGVVDMQIYYVDTMRQYGVKARQCIKKGTFLCQYLGGKLSLAHLHPRE